MLTIESLDQSHILQKNIKNLKQNLKEKIFLNNFYLQHFQKIVKLQKFFKSRFQMKKSLLNNKNPLNLLEKLKSENLNLKKENFKLKTTNKSLILEMFVFS